MKHALLVVLSLVVASSAVRAQTVNFGSVADTRILGGGGLTGMNDGSNGLFTAFRNDGNGNLQRGLLLFDISTLNGAQITNATLTLATVPTIGETNGNSGGPTDIYRIANDWVESEASWDVRADIFPWLNSPGDFTGTGGDSLVSPYASNSDWVGSGEGKLLAWDVTVLVQQWLDGTYDNYGFGLNPGADQVMLAFYSREGAGIAPQLSITLAAVPEPASVAVVLGLIGLGAVTLRRSRKKALDA